MAMPNGNRDDKIDLNLSLGPPKIDLNLSLGPPKIDLNLSLMPSSSQQNANNEENISNIQTSQTDAQKFPWNCAQTFNTFGLHQKQTMIAFDRTCNPLKEIVQLSLSFLGLSLSMDPYSLISSEDLFQKIEQKGMSSCGNEILSWIQKNFEDRTPNRQLFDKMAQRIQKGIALFNNEFNLNVKLLHQKQRH
uniref:Uncharacterized protein n=1 Tax=Globodera rostochiensis TaxID=31243 RepID=A0A914IFZ1_GLORO